VRDAAKFLDVEIPGRLDYVVHMFVHRALDLKRQSGDPLD
jgi:hypothetical protein